MLFGGAVVRLIGIGSSSLWYDEMFTLRASGLPLASLISDLPAARHPPLYYATMHFWLMFGSGESWARGLSFTAGIVSILLTYLLGRELFSRRAGLWAAALVSVSPFLVWYSRDATDYSWAIMFVLASLYFLARGVKRGGWKNWLAYSLVTLAAAYTHFFAAFVLLGEIPLFLLVAEDWRERIKPFLTSLLAITLMLIPWLVLLSDSNKYQEVSLKLPPVKAFITGAETAPVTFIEGYAGQIENGAGALGLTRLQVWIVAALFILFLAALLLSPVLRARLMSRSALGLGLVTMILIAGPMFLLLANAQFVAGRYYAMAAPLFMLLLALGITAAPEKLEWLAGIALIALLTFFLVVEMGEERHDDWRGIMSVVNANGGENDKFLCFPYHHCIVAQEHYGVRDLPVQGGTILPDGPVIMSSDNRSWDGFGGQPASDTYYDAASLTARMASDLDGSKTVWLVTGTGRGGIYAPSSMVVQALSQEWKPVQSWDFTTLSITEYVQKQV